MLLLTSLNAYPGLCIRSFKLIHEIANPQNGGNSELAILAHILRVPSALGQRRAQSNGDGKDKNMLQLWKEKASSRELSGTQEVQPLWQEGSCGKGLLGEACRQEAQAEGQASMRSIRNPLAGVVVEEGCGFALAHCKVEGMKRP